MITNEFWIAMGSIVGKEIYQSVVGARKRTLDSTESNAKQLVILQFQVSELKKTVEETHAEVLVLKNLGEVRKYRDHGKI